MSATAAPSSATGLAELLATGHWTTAPLAADLTDGRLVVRAAAESDAWQKTSYGFVHENEHALVREFGSDAAIEVSFVLDFDKQFDQAGVFLRHSNTEWIKAGVEYCDGAPQAGTVVTHGGFSDWSVSPVSAWFGRMVTVRASRSGDAVTVRARVDDEPFRLLRVAYLDPKLKVEAGLYCCAPTREGLAITFTSVRFTEPDAALH